jgi:hypothetical protein
MLFIELLTLAAAAATVSANPVQRRAVLPLKHVSNVSSIKNIVSKGHSRINKINNVHTVAATADASSGPVTNEDVTYVAGVSIGGRTVSTNNPSPTISHEQNLPEFSSSMVILIGFV